MRCLKDFTHKFGLDCIFFSAVELDGNPFVSCRDLASINIVGDPGNYLIGDDFLLNKDSGSVIALLGSIKTTNVSVPEGGYHYC